MLRRHALCSLAGLLAAGAITATAATPSAAEDPTPAGPTLATDEYDVVNLPANPSWLVADEGELTKVSESDIAVMANQFGATDKLEKERLLSSDPLARDPMKPSLGSTKEPVESGIGDLDNDGSPEVVTYVDGVLSLTKGLKLNAVNRSTLAVSVADRGDRPVGVGIYELPDETAGRVWLARRDGRITFYELTADGLLSSDAAHAKTLPITLVANQELLDASFHSRLDKDPGSAVDSPIFGIEVLVNSRFEQVSKSNLEQRTVRFEAEDGTTVVSEVDDWLMPWLVESARIDTDTYNVESAYDPENPDTDPELLPRRATAILTSKQDDPSQTYLLGDFFRAGFCPSTDPGRLPEVDIDVHGSTTTFKAPDTVATCASDNGSSTADGRRKIRVDMVGINGFNAVSTTHEYVTPVASGRISDIQVDLDTPCAWLEVATGKDACGTSAFGDQMRREVIVSYDDSAGAGHVTTVSRNPEAVVDTPDHPASTWAQSKKLGGFTDPYVIPLPPMHNKVKVKLGSRSPAAETVTGAPRPLVVLASPPYVSGANQVPLAGPTYNAREESGSSTETHTSSTLRASIGVGLEDPTGLFGVSASATVEAESGQSLEYTTTVTRNEQFVGSTTEDTIVYTVPEFWKYTGQVTSSSMGAGLDTTTTLLVPKGEVITSAPLSTLQKDHPEIFGTSAQDRGWLDRVLTHTPGNPGTYTEWGTEADTSAGVRDYCDNTSFDSSVPPVDQRNLYPFGVKSNPFVDPTRVVTPKGPGILASARHVTNEGSTSEGAGFQITDSTTQSSISTLSLDVDLAVKAGGIEVGAGAGRNWGTTWTSSFATGVDFLAYVGLIPTQVQDDEKYDWRVFLCKKKLDAESGGVPVWVLNYTVDGYQGSGGLEPLADLSLEEPVHSVNVGPQPALSWNQESGTVKSFDVELDAIGAQDHRQIGGVEELATTAAAAARPAAITATWAELDQSKALLQNQLYRWRVTATDFFGNTTQSEWEHFVTEGPPTAASLETSDLTPDVNQEVTLTAQHAGDATSYTFELGDGREVTQAGKTLRTSYPVPGVYPAQVSVTNGYGTATARTTLSVGPAATDDSYTAAEDEVLTRNAADGVLANDSGGESVLLTGPATHGTARLNADGSFTYTPHKDYCGDDAFGYAVRGGGAIRYATAAIEVACVNDAPVGQPLGFAGQEDSPLEVGTPGVLANATDVDVPADTIEAELVTPPGKGDVTLRADGGFTYTPAPDSCGSDSFSWRPTDGKDPGDAVRATLDIVCVNDLPVGQESTHPGTEDTPLAVDAPGVLSDTKDADLDPLTAELVSEPGTGALTLHRDGGFDFVPAPDFCGPARFAWAPGDGHGLGRPVTATIMVACVDDAPTGPVNSFDAIEDTVLGVDAPGVLKGAADVDGDPFSAALRTQASHGVVDLSASGAFTYTPDENYCGPDHFVWHPDGTLAGEPVRANLAVACVNDAPVAGDDRYDAVTGTTLKVAAPGVLANDSDPVEGQPVHVVPETSTTGGGTLTVGATGGLSYTPRADFQGTDVATYRLRDEDGAEATGRVTFQVRSGTTLVARDTKPVFDLFTLTTTLTMSARLQGVEVPRSASGATVRFTLDGQPFCTGVTGADGVASCTAKYPFSPTLHQRRYTATFDGNELWLPSVSAPARIGSSASR